MMSGQDNVMIAYWVGEEIRCLTLVGQLDHLLRTAEIGHCLITHETALCDEMAREVAAHLKDRHRPLLHIASDAHADA